MLSALGVVLVLAAVVAEAAFLATGAGRSDATGPLVDLLGPAAGSPALASGGGILLLVGTLLLGRQPPRSEGEARPGRYALPEVVTALSTAAAAAYTVALLLGVARGTPAVVLAALALGGLLHTLVALAVGLRLLVAAEKRRLLLVPGLSGAGVLAFVYLLVIVLGA